MRREADEGDVGDKLIVQRSVRRTMTNLLAQAIWRRSEPGEPNRHRARGNARKETAPRCNNIVRVGTSIHLFLPQH